MTTQQQLDELIAERWRRTECYTPVSTPEQIFRLGVLEGMLIGQKQVNEAWAEMFSKAKAAVDKFREETKYAG